MSSLHGFGLATAILAASGAVAIASWSYISARRRRSSDSSIKPVKVEDKEDLGSVPTQTNGRGAESSNKPVQVVSKEEIGSVPYKDAGNGEDTGITPVHVVAKEQLCSLPAQVGGKVAEVDINIPLQMVEKEELCSVPAQDADCRPDLGIKPVQMMDKEELCSIPDQDEGKGTDVGIKPVQKVNMEELVVMQDQDVGKGVDLVGKSVEVGDKEELYSILAHDGSKREDTHLSKAYEDHKNTNKDLNKEKQEDDGTTPDVTTLVYMKGKAIDSGRTPLEKEINTCTSEMQTKGKSSQVLVLGLDGSGKTSVLNSIAANKGKLITTPTEGVNAMCVSSGSSKMEFLEIGGSEQLRPYWKMYLARAFAVIFVVDSADHSRLPLAKRHLHQLIQQDSVVPLIVLANKQDLGNAHHITDIHDALALSEICENRKLFLIGTHVTKEGGDISSGIQDAKEFLAQLQT